MCQTCIIVGQCHIALSYCSCILLIYISLHALCFQEDLPRPSPPSTELIADQNWNRCRQSSTQHLCLAHRHTPLPPAFIMSTSDASSESSHVVDSPEQNDEQLNLEKTRPVLSTTDVE